MEFVLSRLPVKGILIWGLMMWCISGSGSSNPNASDLRIVGQQKVRTRAVSTASSNSNSTIVTSTMATSAIASSIATSTTASNNKNCSDGKAFMSLLPCRKACEETRRNINDSNVPNIRFLFKLLILNKSEYEILSDNTLRTSVTNNIVSTNYYSVSENDTLAYVCYQMTTKFDQCKKWLLDKDEFEYNNKSRTLAVHNFPTLEIGDFYMHRSMNHAQVCRTEPEAQSIRRFLQLTTVSISAIALLSTFVLALCIPALDIKRNTVLMSHLFVLCAAYSVMVIKLIVADNQHQVARIALSVLQQYLFLAAFFWINVQAFDLCRTLTHLRWHPGPPTNSKRNLWIMYSFYAWGVPLLISGLTLTAELTLSEDSIFYPSLRNYGWFKNDKLVPLVYFYIPIGFVLLTNLIMFIITVASLFRVGKGVISANKRIHQQLFQLYLKLVLVMGLCWIMEVASWAEGDSSYWWAITDTINCLQGLFIFIIYICKRSAIKTIVEHCKRSTKSLAQVLNNNSAGKTEINSNNTDTSDDAQKLSLQSSYH